MTAPVGVVLDAGAFIALERRDKTMVALAQRLRTARTPLVTSAAVVAQVWRGGHGHQVPVAFLLRHTEVVDLTHPVARVLGKLMGRAGKQDAVDAHVAWLARERGWSVLTSDPDDLLALEPNLIVERI